jgi:hypothetical protein
VKKPKENSMVRLVVLIPQSLRNGLRQEAAKTGVPIAEQVRSSLLHWLKACERDPHGALGMVGKRVHLEWKAGQQASAGPAAGPTAGQQGHGKPLIGLAYASWEEYWADPEPPKGSTDWQGWSKRQGNFATHMLSKHGQYAVDYKP